MYYVNEIMARENFKINKNKIDVKVDMKPVNYPSKLLNKI